MKKAFDAHGVDWIEVVIPPENPEEEAEYTLRAHLTFLLSNWECIYGRGCPGLFGVQDSSYPDDTGCCTDSFYFVDREEVETVRSQMDRLGPEDWDDRLRHYVEKNGFVNVKNNSDDEEKFVAKGRVFEGGCVFQNRHGGSSGKPGCAFHHLGARTGEDHVDVMPQVCWQLPLRYADRGNDTYELSPWDVSQWNTEMYTFQDRRYHACWWCMDTPEAYVGESSVYKTLEREIRKTIGDHAYEVLLSAIEERLASGNTYRNMPGATVNDGRPLLPLLVGNRTPRREPSPYPAILDKMKDNNNGSTS